MQRTWQIAQREGLRGAASPALRRRNRSTSAKDHRHLAAAARPCEKAPERRELLRNPQHSLWVHGIAGARPFSGNLKLRCCGIRRSKTPLFRVADADGVFFLRRIRSPGLSFSFLRTFSFFRPKERETAVLVETAVSGAGSSQPQPPRQSGRRFPSRASVCRRTPRRACPAAVQIVARVTVHHKSPPVSRCITNRRPFPRMKKSRPAAGFSVWFNTSGSQPAHRCRPRRRPDGTGSICP